MASKENRISCINYFCLLAVRLFFDFILVENSKCQKFVILLQWARRRICNKIACVISTHNLFCSFGDSIISKRSTLLSIADSRELRCLLIILYTMVETLRREDESDSEDMLKTRQEFLHDLGIGSIQLKQ